MTIPAGEAFVQLQVVAVQDSAAEGHEGIRIELGSSLSYDPGIPNFASLDLIDAQSPYVWVASTRNSTVSESVDVDNAPTVEFRRSGGDLSLPLSIYYVLSGQANYGADYVIDQDDNNSSVGRSTFLANQTTMELTLAIADDEIHEPGNFPEHIILRLVPTKGNAPYQIDPATARAGQITIRDNDSNNNLPQVRFDHASSQLIEGSGHPFLTLQ